MDQIDIIERLWTKLKYDAKDKYQINSLTLILLIQKKRKGYYRVYHL